MLILNTTYIYIYKLHTYIYIIYITVNDPEYVGIKNISSASRCVCKDPWTRRGKASSGAARVPVQVSSSQKDSWRLCLVVLPSGKLT